MCADIDGFSLHAAVLRGADARKATAQTGSPQSLCLARRRQSSLVLLVMPVMLETVEARLYLAARVVMDIARGKGL